MGWLDVFRKRPKSAQGDPANGINAACEIAEKGIVLQESGGTWSTSTDNLVLADLIAALDTASALSPNNPDILLAKYSGLEFLLRGEDASAVLKHVLAVDPGNFDGQMLRDYHSTWRHLFHFPAWSENRAKLHPVMADYLRRGQALQLVRDGVSLGLAVVNSVNSNDFPSHIRRSGWKLVWSQTPSGPIACHYAMLDYGQSKPFKQEAFVPHVAEASPTVRSGYWILRRLAHIQSCFVLFVDGDKVLHNSKYTFPASLRSTVKAMDQALAKSGPIRSAAECKAAAQWYMQNVDFNSIGF